MLSDFVKVRLLTLNDFPECPEVIEDGLSFHENAIKKAIQIAKYTGKTAVADDSGLEVFALGGRPGVFSARYAGEGANDRSNNQKLLKEMEGIEDNKRGARFVCVIALATPDGHLETFEGTVEGTISKQPLGNRGFGYDPLFIPNGWDKSFAEVTPEQKDAISHRSKALKKLKDYLETEFYKVNL